MKLSPRVMGFSYSFLATLFVVFAIVHVQLDGWGFLTYAILAIAALDYMIAWNAFKKSAAEKQEQNNH
ncbi:hypothetical protein HNR44_003002 [Geomicrobium halophilum]|uniref:DUF4305 domain-containing protein n=1 Tax=Geomicrobium halophilum TaxID=549000 RepID=A0A841Q0H7_9BACL|nr:YdiK family protein [Geomicrobium halophilum]MBB6451012.1 hypothetical protein [Geomicrobium halophilum]